MRRPRVSIDPGMMGGQPCIDGRRITAEQMAGVWYLRSWSIDEMQTNWPGLTLGDLLVAFWYMGKYGGRIWRERWEVWADRVHGDLWGANPDYGAVALPPQCGEDER